MTASDQVLILPGWLNAGPCHWQSRWQAAHGYVRVDQHDWARPLRGDWITRLEDVVTGQNPHLPITLVAHSVGCLLVAAWAALSRNAHRVTCAFLVAPCDVTLEALRPALGSWKPITARPAADPHPPMQPDALLASTSQESTPHKLPFRSLLLASHNDPYCSFGQAQAFATAWGSTLVDCGACGHSNAESGLGDWPQGHALLLALQRGAPCETRSSRHQESD